MVATPSAAAQASEMERKRKQTLERTKANHLSRQLQMRLQYARLKVDHGWQRQNLNEVENLYFHHSHRGTKTHHPRPSLVVCPSDDNSAAFSSSSQLDVTYRASMSRSATLDAFLGNSGPRTTMGVDPVPTSTPTPPVLLSQTGVGSHDLLASGSALPDLQTSLLRDSSHTPSKVSSLAASSLCNGRSATESISLSESPGAVTETAAAMVNPTPQQSHLFTPTRTTSTPTPTSASLTKIPLLAHKSAPSFAKNDKFSLNKPSTLTYDSFWSGMQSKSYPTLKTGGSGLDTAVMNNPLPNSVPNVSTSTTTALGTLSTPSLAPNIASSSTSPSRPFIPSYSHYPPAPSSLASSITPAHSLPSASTPNPLFLPQTTASTSAPQSQPLQIQMQQNRLLLDSLAAWNLLASQQYPGPMNIQQNFIAGPTAAYPLLANLSASYAQAFNAAAEVQGPHSQSIEIGASSGTTPPVVVVVVPPSNTSAVSSPAPPPVVATCVGQEGS